MSNIIKCPKCNYELQSDKESKCPRCGAIQNNCHSCAGNCLKCGLKKK